MRSQYVTDPNLIAQLNQGYSSQATNPSKYVTDPAILSELNKGYGMNSGSGLEAELANAGKSAMAGLGQLGQTVAKDITTGGLGGWASGMNIINALPKNSQAQLSGGIQPLESYNIAQHMNIPNTTTNRFIQGTFKAMPAIIGGIATGGAGDIPALAGSIASQGGMGAALSNNHPIEGALVGSALQGVGEIAPQIVGKTAQGFVKKSMDRLVPYAQGLMKEAQKGYGVLDKLGKTKLVDPIQPSVSSVFGKISNPKQTADYLESIKNNMPANSDVLQSSVNSLKPNYSQVVTSRFSPDTLSSFQSLKKGNSYNLFNKFSEDPSAQNAGKLYRALGSARTGVDYDTDQIYSDMRDQLKDNIIIPGIQKTGSINDIETYGNADMHYRQYKQLFGNDSQMENLAKGNISSSDMNSSQYYDMLKRSKINGAFNSTVGQPKTLPMQEYEALQAKMINPGFIQRALNEAAKPASFIAKKTPLIKAGILGYQSMPNR